MKTNDLVRNEDGSVYRILSTEKEKSLVIDCTRTTMPRWVMNVELERCVSVKTDTFDDKDYESEMSAEDKKIMHDRFTVIAPILSFLADDRMRAEMINRVSEQNEISKQTVRKYLCKYLASQKIESLAPCHNKCERKLTPDEKNFRWALNKFYYTQRRNNLKTAYTMMLKERYTCADGKLFKEYPPFHRFRYFYIKNRTAVKELISRGGITNYQRNERPLLGTVGDFAPAVGTGLLDSTICDIYLVNGSGQLVGRPILTICVDAYTSLVCGYCLSWEGGIFSLSELMENVVVDKVLWCQRFGIHIGTSEWPVSMLPGVLVTDRGREYTGHTFEQITELGVKLINLPGYRPELKGVVEGAFKNIQSLYTPYLKGKGVVEPDYAERGAHDYRLDACLTMDEFEKVILRCIIHYNSKRLLENFSYSSEMVEDSVLPYASTIYAWSSKRPDANLICATSEMIHMTLLPRTMGRFTRKGLIVNKQRYRHCEGNFTERYISGGNASAAFDPDDISHVWLIEKGEYIL